MTTLHDPDAHDYDPVTDDHELLTLLLSLPADKLPTILATADEYIYDPPKNDPMTLNRALNFALYELSADFDTA